MKQFFSFMLILFVVISCKQPADESTSESFDNGSQNSVTTEQEKVKPFPLRIDSVNVVDPVYFIPDEQELSLQEKVLALQAAPPVKTVFSPYIQVVDTTNVTTTPPVQKEIPNKIRMTLEIGSNPIVISREELGQVVSFIGDRTDPDQMEIVKLRLESMLDQSFSHPEEFLAAVETQFGREFRERFGWGILELIGEKYARLPLKFCVETGGDCAEILVWDNETQQFSSRMTVHNVSYTGPKSVHTSFVLPEPAITQVQSLANRMVSTESGDPGQFTIKSWVKGYPDEKIEVAQISVVDLSRVQYAVESTAQISLNSGDYSGNDWFGSGYGAVIIGDLLSASVTCDAKMTIKILKKDLTIVHGYCSTSGVSFKLGLDIFGYTIYSKSKSGSSTNIVRHPMGLDLELDVSYEWESSKEKEIISKTFWGSGYPLFVEASAFALFGFKATGNVNNGDDPDEANVALEVGPYGDIGASLEGGINLLLVKGGVGGEIHLLSDEFMFVLDLYWGGSENEAGLKNTLTLLQGELYFFADKKWRNPTTTIMMSLDVGR